MIRFVNTDDTQDDLDFEETLSRARAGDQSALEELFRRFYPRVESTVHRNLSMDVRQSRPWLSTRFSTGDVVQDVFRSVLMDLDAFQGNTEAAFAGYLAMVVRNRILDAVRFHEAARRDGRRPVVDTASMSLEGKSRDPVEEALLNETNERFLAALSSFPERERLLLRARFEKTASFEDLAEQLGYGSISSVRRAFFVAQARIATLMGLPQASANPESDKSS